MKSPRRKVIAKRLTSIGLGACAWCDRLECGHVLPMHDRYPDAPARACRQCGEREVRT